LANEANGKPAGEQAAAVAPAVSKDGEEFRSAFAQAAAAKSKGEAPPSQTPGAQEGQGGAEGGAAAAGAEGAGGAKDPAKAGSEGSGKGAEAPKPKKNLFADAPPELREAYDSRGQEIARLRNRIHRNNSRTSDGSAAPAGAAAPGAPAPKSVKAAVTEKVKTIREDYPDIGAPVADALEQVAEQLDQQRTETEKANNAAHLRTQLEKLNGAHADWREIVKSEDFGKWALEQGADVQDALRRNGQVVVDGEEAADIVSDYKAHKGIKTNGAATGAGEGSASERPEDRVRRRQAEAGADAGVRTGPGAAQGAPEDDFTANFKMAAAKKQEEKSAQRAGLRR
jgi:hypothetical protein